MADDSPLTSTGRTGEWENDALRLQSIAAETLAAVLERNRSIKLGGARLESYDRTIASGLSELKGGIADLESRLTSVESRAIPSRNEDDLKKWEEAILLLSKQCDRIEFLNRENEDNLAQRRAELMNNPSSSSSPRSRTPLPESNRRSSRIKPPASTLIDIDSPSPSGALNESELLSLQERIIDDQDAHLDELSATISRQKSVGFMISDELELHVDLLEQTDTAVERTQNRLASAQRRLNTVESKAENSMGNRIICILIIVLIVVIFLARI
ncbi:hypothetical protein BJ742DRAFT_839732 [Cladochytrium replicatum]|nr:hypothetical protein BJ742DRAFT_839732 [Cladochytrium replicatum]